jgi:hypothetical protein
MTSFHTQSRNPQIFLFFLDLYTGGRSIPTIFFFKKKHKIRSEKVGSRWTEPKKNKIQRPDLYLLTKEKEEEEEEEWTGLAKSKA